MGLSRLELPTLLICDFPQTGVTHPTYMWLSRLESPTLLICDFPQTGVLHSTYMWLSIDSGVTFLPQYNHPGWLGIKDQVVYSGITFLHVAYHELWNESSPIYFHVTSFADIWNHPHTTYMWLWSCPAPLTCDFGVAPRHLHVTLELPHSTYMWLWSCPASLTWDFGVAPLHLHGTLELPHSTYMGLWSCPTPLTWDFPCTWNHPHSTCISLSIDFGITMCLPPWTCGITPLLPSDVINHALLESHHYFHVT